MKNTAFRRLSLAIVALFLCAVIASPALAGNFKTSFSLAESDFESGEFEGALTELAEAIAATKDHDELAKAYVLKARCHAGLGNQEDMRDAFVAALEHDSTLELNSDEVSPELIQVLEQLKATLQAEVSIKSNRGGAMVMMDGRTLGLAPLRIEVPIGRHEFELKDAASYQYAKRTVVIRARQLHEVFIPFDDGEKNDQDDFVSLAEESAQEEEKESLEMDTEVMRSASGERAGGRRAYFLIDLRYKLGGAFGSSPSELDDDLKLDTDLKPAGFELGLGIAGRDLLAMVAGTFDGSAWGATVKLGCHPRLIGIFGLQGSIDIPMVFPDGDFYMGVGASVGAFIRPVHMLSIFLEGSYKYFFLTPGADDLNADKHEFFGNNIWEVSVGVRFFL